MKNVHLRTRHWSAVVACCFLVGTSACSGGDEPAGEPPTSTGPTGRGPVEAAPPDGFCEAYDEASGGQPAGIRPLPYSQPKEVLQIALENSLTVLDVEPVPDEVAEEWAGLQEFYRQEEHDIAALEAGETFTKGQQRKREQAMRVAFDSKGRTVINYVLANCS